MQSLLQVDMHAAIQSGTIIVSYSVVLDGKYDGTGAKCNHPWALIRSGF